MSSITGNVTTGSGATNAYYQNLNSKRTGGADGGSGKNAGVTVDQYTAGAAEKQGEARGVYSNAALQKAQSMADAQYASMRGMVESLIGGTSGPQGQAFWATAASQKFENFSVSEATQAKAQEMIGDDGYFGVKKTTDRIMEFAKALAGSGASEKDIESLRRGVQAGFDAVAKMFGGFDKLPDVSKNTYDSVMKEFDSWVSGSKLVES